LSDIFYIMRRYLLFFTFITGLTTFAKAPQWGKTGHRATAEIATEHLTDKAKAAIDDLLEGYSPAFVSTYADEIKSDPAYREYSIWHYINIPEGKTYDEVKTDLGPNIIWAIDKVKKGLKDPSTSRDKKQFYLKMLIHLIGDLHQPLHIGRADDLGGNKIIVFWFGEPSNLHKVWDEEMIDSYQMSYTELAKNQKRLSKKELQAIQKGNPVDWLKENLEITHQIYESADVGNYLSYNYMYDWMSVVHDQLQKGGIRLAKELNEIFN